MGINVWRTRVTLPAVPTSNRKVPALSFPGLKTNSVAPTSNPCKLAEQSSAAALTPVMCCGLNPGSALPARMLKRWISFDNTAARATAVRRTCPPPSPRLPSTSIILRSALNDYSLRRAALEERGKASHGETDSYNQRARRNLVWCTDNRPRRTDRLVTLKFKSESRTTSSNRHSRNGELWPHTRVRQCTQSNDQPL